MGEVDDDLSKLGVAEGANVGTLLALLLIGEFVFCSKDGEKLG